MRKVFKPIKQTIYLGNIIDSSSMTFKLPEKTNKRIIEECHVLIKKSKATIRLVSRIIGLFLFPAFQQLNMVLYIIDI